MSEPSDALLLYWSLVADHVVPPGYEQDFVSLEPAMVRTSDASVRKATKVDSVTAAVWRHERSEADAKPKRRDKSAEVSSSLQRRKGPRASGAGGSSSPLRDDRRASTLRSRVRVARRFLAWDRRFPPHRVPINASR